MTGWLEGVHKNSFLRLVFQLAAELAQELSNSSHITFFSNWIWVLILRNKKITTSKCLWKYMGFLWTSRECNRNEREIQSSVWIFMLESYLDEANFKQLYLLRAHWRQNTFYVCFLVCLFLLYFFSGKRQNQSHWSDLFIKENNRTMHILYSWKVCESAACQSNIIITMWRS